MNPDDAKLACLVVLCCIVGAILVIAASAAIRLFV